MEQEGPKLNKGVITSLGDVLRKRVISNSRFHFPVSENAALHILAACYETEVNRRNRECVFDRYTLSHLMKIARVLVQPSTKFGIILGGTWGNGKSTMMYAIRRAVNYLYDAGALKEIMPEYWKPEFEIYEAVEFEDMIKDRKEFKRVAGLNILGIDDLGVQKNKVFDWGNVVEPIKRLIEMRYNKQLYTVITTNQTRSQMKADIDDGRIDDRMEEMFHRIGFSSEISYRRVDVKTI